MENSNHLALYRKWRPKTFDEVYGQDHIVDVLKYETEHNQISHAYLFCGSRGTGKTSCAKILAKSVNCLSPVNGNPCGKCEACLAIDSGTTTDVVEMDAASNNGVDNIRDIRDEVNFTPADLKYRVYIIDEVHMLSVSAFNALLKTLEEPPAHVIFILATTELQKLPATIISRCQRFDFRRISIDSLMARINVIAGEEGIDIDKDAAYTIARMAQGGMRDAISLLELCSGGGRKVTVERVNDAIGSVGRENVIATVKAIANADYDGIFGIVADAVDSSKDILVFWQELISFYRDILIVKTAKNASRYLDLTETETKLMNEVASLFNKSTVLAHIKILNEALFSMQRSNAVKRTVAELALIRMSDKNLDTSNEALLSRLEKLEDKVKIGSFITYDAPVIKDDDKQSDDNQSAVIDTTEESVTEEKAPVTEKKETDADKKLTVPEKQTNAVKGIKNWAEMYERIAKEHQSLASLLKGSRAFVDGNGKITVKTNNPFALSQIENGTQRAMIINALMAELGRPLKESDVTFDKLTPDDDMIEDETIFTDMDRNENTEE